MNQDENKDETTKIEEVNQEKSESLVDDLFMEDIYKDNYIDLYKLEGLEVRDQSKIFSLLLTNIYKDYDDIDYGNIRKYALKCLKLSCDPEENELKLPYKLLVTKENNRMYFKFEKDKTLLLFLIILGLFIAFAIAATYFGLRYLSIEHLNIDINNDGIADLNIDMSGNEKAEINISEDRKKPYMNIDYKGNRKAVFNIDSDNTGKPTKNLINQDTNNDGICDLNCDTNKDGWPETNIDLDGDGKADLFIDTDNDRKPDLNFDTNGDGTCDLHCDTNGDNLCDENCVSNVEVIENVTGNSTIVGNNNANIETAQFIVDFVDSKEIIIKELFPEDQPSDLVTKFVTKRISIENKSALYVRYRIELVVDSNTFTSNNFVYDIKATNGGYETDFTIAPKVTSNIADKVVIAPRTKQTYDITFKLKGLNTSQNFDQGKTFAGYFQVYVYN